MTICSGPLGLMPACAALNAVTSVPAAVVGSAFDSFAQTVAAGAGIMTGWLWATINDSTTISLTDPQMQKMLVITTAMAGILIVVLAVVQVALSALRGESGGVQRAVTGIFKAAIGAPLAVAIVGLLLTAVDLLSAGIVQFVLGTDLGGMGQKLSVSSLTALSNSWLIATNSLIICVAAFICWAALMVRKMMIIVAVIMAALAFSGATADFSRGWVKKWIEFVGAMIFSQLLMVLMLLVGVSMLDGAGLGAAPSVNQRLTQVAMAGLFMSLAGFAPWAAIKMAHIGGDAFQNAHMTAKTATVGAATIVQAPMKIAGTAATAGQAAQLGSKIAPPASPKPPARPAPAPAADRAQATA